MRQADLSQPGHPHSLIKVPAVHERVAKGLTYRHGCREDRSDRRMFRLIRVFAGAKITLLVLSCRGLFKMLVNLRCEVAVPPKAVAVKLNYPAANPNYPAANPSLL